MKPSRFFFVILIVLMGVLLSACGSAVTATSWPGVTPVEDRVYVSYTDRVYAINIADGSMAWRYPADKSAVMVYAAPAVTADQVLVGDYKNVFHGLNKSTGVENWKYEGAKDRYIASPLVVGETVFAPNADGTLYAFSLNGNLTWKFSTSAALWARPVSDGTTVYLAGMDHKMYALDAASGKELWSVDMGGSMPFEPALGDGKLYISTLANELVALNTSDGSVLWRTPFTERLYAQPVLNENSIFIGDLKGGIYAVNAADGQTIWKQELDHQVTGSATIIENGVVFATDNGDLVCVSFAGERLWTRSVTGTLYTAPIALGDKLFIGLTGDKTTFLSVMTTSGNTVWSFAVPK